MTVINADPYSVVELPRAAVTLSDREMLALPWVTARAAAIAVTPYSVRISTTGFAGLLRIQSDLAVQVAELVPGTVEGLLPLVAEPSIRMAKEWAWAGSRMLDPIAVLAEAFAKGVLEATASGVDRRYSVLVNTGSPPRGRFDPPGTARLWAKGHVHQIATLPRRITDDTELNNALLAGAIRAERVLAETDRARLAGVACARLSGAAAARLPDFQAARGRAREIGRYDLEALVDEAEMLVLGVPLLPRIDTREVLGSAWIDVPSLFERAVFRMAKDVYRTASVERGSSTATPLLTPLAGKGIGNADPDIVVSTGEGTLILDAKYRKSGNDPDRDEIYQLMAHADAYRARFAALITPALSSQQGGTRLLGRDARGCTYAVLSADPRDPEALRGVLSWDEALSDLRIAIPS